MVGTALAQSAPAINQSASPSGADSATATTGNGKAEEIVVTGSRLKTSNATSEAPVVVVTSAQIAHTSAETLEDVLTRLPEIGTSGIYATTNNGGDGSSCIDLRNLGVERTLVLVDGKRFVQTSGGIDCVDLNNIPLDLVDRIEILKDGASTTYGADAVAGVVNIILKHSFSGVTFRANGSIATQAGDDKQGELSATAGTTFDHGNFTVSAEYLNRGAVNQSDRSFANPPVQSNNAIGSGAQETGSIYTPNGIVTGDVNTTNAGVYSIFNLVNKGGTTATEPYGAGTQVQTNAQRFNFGMDQVFQGSLEKESLTSIGNYDFNDNISGYIEEFYTHKTTGQGLAPQPVSGGLDASVVPDAYVVPEGNPYLTSLLGPNSGPVDIYKRETQFGERQYEQFTDTFQFNGGFKGDLGHGFSYEVFFQYGQSDNTLETLNSINFQKLEQETGFQQTVATPDQIAAIGAVTGGFDPSTFGIYNPAVCQASAGCVLSNPFGQQLSAAAVNYAKFTQVDTSRDTLKIYGGSLTNSDVYDLPAGPIGISFGAEHRTETGEFSPDNLVQTGVTETAPAQPTAGSFDVTEVYGEARVPILKDLPGAKDLHIDLGGRYFDYNTFGSGETWKVSGNYTPIDGLRFRGSDGVAFRQPSITDLFEGQTIGFNPGVDPCDHNQVTTYTPTQQANVRANCLKQGVNPATFTQVGDQIQTIVGGNPNLSPETARTQTLGIVATPPFIPRLAVTVDYFRTKIDNTIGVVGTQNIVDGCYTSANLSSPLCALINPRLGSRQLNTVVGTNENLGVERTEGLDIGTTYSYPSPYGTFAFSNDATYTLKFQNQNLPNGPFIGDLGLIQIGISTPAYPRLRDNASVDWSFGDFSLGYRMRFIQGTLFYTSDPVNPALVASSRTPSIFYHDIYGGYNYKNFSFNFGVDNLFNKQPPYVNDGATNTDPAVYDILGRVLYLKTTLRF